MTIHLHHVSPLIDNDLVAVTVDGFFAAAFVELAIPADRDALTGVESCIYVTAGDAAAPVGAAVYYNVGHGRVWLDFLYVAPAFRRRGLGRLLLRQVAGVVSAAGHRKLMLGTGFTNNAMRCLATREGYAAEAVTYGLDLPARAGLRLPAAAA